MSEKLKEMSAVALVDPTASDVLAPGNSSVSALFGSLSAALMGMVAGLTIGEKKYVEVEAEACEVAAATEALKKELVEEIDRDFDSFSEFMAAMTLSEDTDEEEAARKAAMQNGLKSVAKVPCHVAETAARAFLLAKTVVGRGNTNAVTDSPVTVMAARTAVIGAGLNVKINLASIEDEDFVVEYSVHAAVLEEQTITAGREISMLPELTRET